MAKLIVYRAVTLCASRRLGAFLFRSPQSLLRALPGDHACWQSRGICSFDWSFSTFKGTMSLVQWDMAHLIDLDTSDSLFGFFGLRGPRLPVLTCDRCTCFGDYYFARFTEDGAAHWFEGNVRPNWLPENISTWPPGPWTEIPVRLSPRRPIEAADRCMEVPASQIGGLPCWVQDAAYPQCPSCKQTMKFIAQLDNAQFPSHEGIYYAFLCESCRITATTHQQT